MTDEHDDSSSDDLFRRVADGESVDWEKEEERAEGTEDQRVVRGMKKLADMAAERGLGTAEDGAEAEGRGDEPTQSLHAPSPAATAVRIPTPAS